MPAQGKTNGAIGLVAQVAAVLSIGAGVIHVSAAGDHTNLPVMLAGFVVVATLQILLGAALVLGRPSRLVVGAGLLLMLGAIAAWVVSRTAGLPFLEDGHTEPVGFKDGVTVLFEAASIPALLLLLSPDLARVSLPPQLGNNTLAAVAVACFLLLTPALLLGGGEHHTHEEAVALGIHTDGPHSESADLAHADSKSAHPRKEKDAHAGDQKHARAGGKDKHDREHTGHSGDGSTTTLASTDHGHSDSGSDPNHSGGGDQTHDGSRDHGNHDRKRDRGRDKGHGKHRDDDPGKDDEEGGEDQPGNPVEAVIADVIELVQPPRY